MTLITLWYAKFAGALIQLFNVGSGSTWPGHLALSIQSNFVKKLLSQNKHLKIVVVAGTNGKTTTSKLLTTILESNNQKVFRNEEGANLLNGIASSLLRYSRLNGKISYDAAIFEVDENSLPLVLKQITPHAVVLLNLFRDQLDRYGEVHTIAQKWMKALKTLPETSYIIANGDDPQINFIAQKKASIVSFFGVSAELMKGKNATHDVDSIYCPNCGKKLEFLRYAYSHLGDYKCTSCEFARRDIITFTNYFNKIPLKGLYNRYNINAALLTINQAFSISVDNGIEALKDFKPAFGRQEQIVYQDRNIFMLLSKNPTGFNQSLSIVSEDQDAKTILLVLNDRIPDGRDVSWIWDIDLKEIVDENITLILSGDRTYDLALRLQYELKESNPVESADKITLNEHISVIENLEDALNFAIEKTPKEKTLYVLPTYSAMLEVRKLLTGKKLL
jgi:lipid II isoglutaminyl synthase (glutamine-hydrolysing)